MGIKIVSAYNKTEEVSKLFTEYTDMLIQNDSSFQKYLDIQNYSEEMEHLESKYGFPDGRLYLVYCDEELAGCIGLRKIGYSHMLLDTLPFLKSAIHMYKKYGFYEIDSYNNSPMDTSIYMKLDL